MSKYDALGAFLGERAETHIPMTFREMEAILGFPLPRSKVHRAWWSNNTSNNVMTQQWLDAGYVTEQVDIAGERLVFRRITSGDDRERPSRETPPTTPNGGGPAASIFGCMKGTIAVPAGVDLTQPVEAAWGEGA